MFGKTVNTLQSDVVIDGNDISGTLHYVEDYTEFSSLPEQQSGNYLALKVDAPEDSTITVEVVGGTKGPVTLDDDKNIVLLIADEDRQSVKVTVEKGSETETRMYSLKNLTLEFE